MPLFDVIDRYRTWVGRRLVEQAEDERRVVLTCDRHFVRARYSDYTFYVRSERKCDQLEEVRSTGSILFQTIVCVHGDVCWLPQRSHTHVP